MTHFLVFRIVGRLALPRCKKNISFLSSVMLGIRGFNVVNDFTQRPELAVALDFQKSKKRSPFTSQEKMHIILPAKRAT